MLTIAAEILQVSDGREAVGLHDLTVTPIDCCEKSLPSSKRESV